MTRIDKQVFGRRRLLKGGILGVITSLALPSGFSWAAHYLDPDEARAIIWGDLAFDPKPVDLAPDQIKAIKQASKVRVLDKRINGYRSADGHWFILDRVIGKHEFIDMAVGIDANGKVTGIEILEYRESYGYEIINKKWLAQFLGRKASAPLRLDKDIKNISGATLSCKHVTDGVTRLMHTWDLVLRHV